MVTHWFCTPENSVRFRDVAPISESGAMVAQRVWDAKVARSSRVSPTSFMLLLKSIKEKNG